MVALAAALAAFTGFGSAIGMGMTGGKAMEAISRQPEAAGKINSSLILSLVIIESTAIYGFVTALMLIGKVVAS